MKTLPVQSKPFPVVLVSVLGIGVILIGFLASFGFSFFKTKLASVPLSDIAPKKYDINSFGKEEYKQFINDATIKTKEEGLAMCKKTGAVDCYALIAVSFNDIGLCKQSSNRKECELKIVEIQKEFSDPDGGGSTPQPQKPEEDTECVAGPMINVSQGTMRILGKAAITLDGRTYQTCCMEGVPNSPEEPAMKSCGEITNPENIFVYTKMNNTYVMNYAMLTIGDKQCNYEFNENGTLKEKSCN